MILLPKEKKEEICRGLTTREVLCPCENESCRCILLSPRFLWSYESFRILVDIPLTITSGYRCPQHNFKVGGAPCSRHTSGEAIDIAAENLLEKYKKPEKVLEIAYSTGFEYCRFYPDRGIFHFDTGERGK